MIADGRLIMVVDDDDDVREIIEVVLRTVGYRVCSAADGLEAWREICLGERPALILLDLMMPRMDGEHFMRTLRGSPARTIPVVLMSGHSSARDQAREVGADQCLTKPIDLDELLTTVARFTSDEATLDSRPASP